jgi:hypothetical protein
MTDPMYSQPEVPQAVDPWATGELRSDPTTSTPTPTTLPQQPMPVPQQPPAMRGVAPVPTPPSTPSGGWEPVSYGAGGGGGGLGRRAVVIAALAALAVVVGVFAFALTNSRNWFSTPSANGTTNPPASTSPPAPGPFAGTDAQDYPKGADGIVVPAASDQPGFTAAQVKAGLEKVKSALYAARLDPKMLTGHDTSVLLGLLAPDAQQPIVKAFSDHDFLGFATQLGEGQHLSSDPIRVKGAMTFSAAVSDDAAKGRLLKIDTNFVWVYGFDGPSTTPGQRMVTIHDQITWYVPADADFSPSSRGLFLSRWHAFTYNMDCTLVRTDLIGLGQPSTVSAGPSIDVNKLLNPLSTADVGANTC